MRWWCSAVAEKWTWTPRPYVGVWILCLGLALAYWRALKGHRDEPVHQASTEAERRRPVWFGLGLLALWVASDWPVGALGASYLSSVHMLQYMIYTLAAAPLLMLGTPEWLGRRILAVTRLRGVYMAISAPVIAAVITNVVLVATHAPVTVDALRATQAGSFVLDMIWLIAGFILWTPIISPLPEARARSAPVKLVYLFVAAALVPMIPGGFLTFSALPLYATYELAPRVGIEALDDQQMAGVLMKIGSLPVIWTVMGVIWFRWYRQEAGDRRPPVKRDPVTGAPLRAAPSSPAAHPTPGTDPAGATTADPRSS